MPIMPGETLTPDGGAIFSTVGTNATSHDGRYVVLDLTRNGVIETEDGKSSVESREFCPILDTQTGCVARDDTGAVCGGAWDEKEAVWHSQLDSGKAESQPMATLEKPTAKAVWAQFSQAKSTDIKPYLRAVLGIENLRACDPANAGNASDYAKIRAALGHSARIVIDRSASSSMPTNVDAEPTWTVTVARSWLYERPSVGSNRHGYLIRGDQVAVTQQGNPDWAKIRYVHDGHPPLEAWLKRQDITR
ncbi:SH3 domain-containing protein [Trinickia dabaoshanensis]|uniref:SH3 domain-containing protein n=1 Tax=Trinickia dabaoshanensis TaxID=564714 RepID=UPI0011AECCB3|nr:SH3 domain-containing protein [Trinickia dabaoshanensis]